MAYMFNNTEFNNVCPDCETHNAALINDYANNNRNSDTSDTWVMFPCRHQQHLHSDLSEEEREQKQDPEPESESESKL